jgi:protease-4
METRTPLSQAGERVVEMPLGPGCAQAGCPKVALIDVDGLLLNQNLSGPYSVGDNPVALFREKLDRIAADKSVCAVVLRINSPGGGATACDLMFQDLLAFRANTPMPVVACLLDVATGGAYLLASAADQVVATPTTITGGIGVIWNSYNLKAFLGLQSVAAQPVKAGVNADMGTVLTLMPEHVEKLLKTICNTMHQHFQARIKQARPRVQQVATIGEDRDVDIFDGRILVGPQACQCGMVDQLGFLEDALAAARAAAHPAQARVVMYHRANDPALSPYAITPNYPIQASTLPSMPGPERSRLPTFLFMWQPDPTIEHGVCGR